MSQLDIAINQAKSALAVNNAKEALKILKPYKKSLKTTNSSNVILHQVYADIYLEHGQLEKAYPLLIRACELDPQGVTGGSEKFFTIGQVTGGKDGISMLVRGIENISSQAGDSLEQEQVDKIVSGLLAMIEIWMTDLCMEPDAELQCEELISKAMEVSESRSPEAWSTLGSIRISQQRFSDANDAFTESWKFFQLKKEAIEKSLEENTGSQKLTHTEYVELLQPLLNLTKMCVEMGSYETALHIVGAIKDIDEDNLEGYYLEGFIHYLMCKLELFRLSNPSLELNPGNIYEFNQHFQELPLDLTNESTKESVYEARVSLSFAVKIGENADPDDEIAQELFSGASGLLQELGGPVDITELLKLKNGEEVNDEDAIELEYEE